MPKYYYQAINESGTTISGVLETDSRDAATHLLSNRGLIPSKISEMDKGPAGLSSLDAALTKVTTWDLILFSKQLATMLRVGIPIIRLLQILESQTENKKMKHVVNAMIADIQAGSSLHDAFKKHPRVFSPLYCSMIHAGEASGSLPEVLDRLIYIIEHERKVKQDVKSALTYPAIVVVFLGVAFFVLLTWVVPQFVRIFQNAGIKIPLPTRICIYMYTFLNNYWWLILLAAAGLLAAAVIYLRTDQGKFVRDTVLMKIPLLGPLFVKTAMSRFASIFAILQSSGVAVLDIIGILSGTIGNYAIARVFDTIIEKLKQGRGIAEPLRSAQYFTPMVVNMVAVGEESGNLDEMLSEVSKHYDVEVEYATNKLSSALGPILTIGLAAVVGFFALAIYLPMWDLTQIVKR
ncbi:MAG: type II secretion system F family protein [Thermodesulfobacteriota bacterium]